MKLLKPLELAYHAVTGLKNLMYRAGVLQPVRLNVPVLSVGNLSFGGVGKTPCIAMLAAELKDEFRINIVTKSYKASLGGPELVNINIPGAALLYGDEACMLQRMLPYSAVWSGPVKADTAVASLRSQPGLVLLDDGFSHRKLERNFDLVLVDSTEGFSGYMREPVSSLKRAHAVMLTKSNLVEAVTVDDLQARIVSAFPHLRSAVFTSSAKSELELPLHTPVLIFCGIGKPESLTRDLQSQGYQIIKQLIFPDHFSYSSDDESRILEKYHELKSREPNLELVTTFKDYVKLQNHDLQGIVRLVQHRMEMPSEQKGALIAQIRKSFQ